MTCAALLLSPILAGCGGPLEEALPGKCVLATSFQLSLASTTGGQLNPVAAAANTRVPGFSIPSTGWHAAVAPSDHIQVLRSGDIQVQVVEGPDGTWQVESGGVCQAK